MSHHFFIIYRKKNNQKNSRRFLEIKYQSHLEAKLGMVDHLKALECFCLGKAKKIFQKERTNEVILNTDEFIALDNAIKVNKDDPKVKAINIAVTEFVNRIARDASRMIRNAQFNVIPAGSFPLNLKINKPDEFDFILECNPQVVLRLDIGHCIMYALREYGITPIQIRSAINFIISWLCQCGERHNISIDLVICRKVEKTVEEYFREIDLSLIGTIFENCIKSNQKVSVIVWPFTLEIKEYDYHDVDTNVFDNELFKVCDKISPNIKSTYRILKFIRDQLFPVWYCYINEHDTFIEKKHFSSFFLKQHLLEEVKTNPSSAYWEESKIHLRLSSILKLVLIRDGKIPGEKDFFNSYDPDFRKIDFVMKKILEDLILWLENGCEKVTVSDTSMIDDFQIVNLYNNLLKIKNRDLCRIYLLFHDRNHYIFKSMKNLPDTNVSRWIYREFYEVINSLVTLDFTSLTDRECSIINDMLILYADPRSNKGDIVLDHELIKTEQRKDIFRVWGGILQDLYKVKYGPLLCYNVCSSSCVNHFHCLFSYLVPSKAHSVVIKENKC